VKSTNSMGHQATGYKEKGRNKRPKKKINFLTKDALK